jgi:hypothetical protein
MNKTGQGAYYLIPCFNVKMTVGVQISIHISFNILKNLLSEFPSIAKTLFSEKKKVNVCEGLLQSYGILLSKIKLVPSLKTAPWK